MFSCKALAASLAIGWTLIASPSASMAQTSAANSRREAPKVDATTGKRLYEAVEKLNAEKYDEARAILGRFNFERLSPYEKSRVAQIMAGIEQAQGNYDAARAQVLLGLESGGLNDQEIVSARFQIAQLYMAEEKWKEGITALEEWFEIAPEPNSSAYYLLAVANYQLGKVDAALEPAQKAVDLSDKPQDSWVQLLLALRIDREEYALAAPLLRRLLATQPERKDYWVQLSSVYGLQGDLRKAVVPLQLAYNAKLLTEEADLRRLAELLVQAEIPHRAARILTEAIERKAFEPDAKTLELLGNCWIASREYDKAIEPLELAAEQAGRGDLYVRVAEVHIQRENWAKAVEMLERGLGKGDLRKPASAQLLMGIALYSQGQELKSRPWFERAARDSSLRNEASGWLRLLDSEAETAAE